MYCYTVVYMKDDKFIISMSLNNEGKIQILDMNGKVLANIGTDSNGEDIFKSPCCLTTDLDGKYAYVSDWYKDEVIEIDLHSYENRSIGHLWHPEGIETDDDGFVYVIETGTGKIVSFHPHRNDTKLAYLPFKLPPNWKPLGICFCSTKKKLYVGQEEHSSIKVLQITDDMDE